MAGDGGEAAATLESRSSNARHALGEGDGGEAAAILESKHSNARHTLGDGDGGEAAAIRESRQTSNRLPQRKKEASRNSLPFGYFPLIHRIIGSNHRDISVKISLQEPLKAHIIF